MTAHEIAVRLLEAEPDDVNPEHYVDAYAQTQGFDDGLMDLVRICRKRYIQLKQAGVLDALKRDAARLRGRPPLDSDIAEGIVWKFLDGSGMLGPMWVYKWLKRHAANHF